MTEINDHDEAALEARDIEAADTIRKTLKRWRDQADECDREAQELRADARRLEVAVGVEAWWTLKGILDEETIESLCNVSPKNLLGGEEG